ncbi:MAG: type II toxin-antitoxin system HicA family toxin [Acidobacteria bacterium]|nr:type II toxin-antitoxin system HicA family toxin [Acidobacteriota bacterium]MCL5288559.1 type II toxin-antitoxin system HicA family toxin [Acidobacteriota bacterium]
MRLPRDLSGKDLAHALRRYGYEIVRQEGSHLRLTSIFKGAEHHISIPDHRQLRIGTLHKVLRLISIYLELDIEDLSIDLFGR